MEPKGLATIQQRFWEFIKAPDGVEAAKPEVAQLDPDSVPLQGWIKAPDEAFAVARLDVYANMYFARIFDCLRGDYEQVERAIEEEYFRKLIVNYLLVYPSNRASLFYIGRHLPTFIDEYEFPGAQPWLADLARLERALTDMFLGEDCEPLTLDDLLSIPPEQWGMLCFQTIPSLMVLELDYPVDRAFKALKSGQEVGELAQEECTIITWREGIGIALAAVGILIVQLKK